MLDSEFKILTPVFLPYALCSMPLQIYYLKSETGNPPEGWESAGQIFNLILNKESFYS